MSFTPAREPSDAGARSAVRRAGIGRADAREAIFGSFDGMTSTLGVVAGLLATRATAPHIVAGAIGIAVAATIGMGAGQYLSDEKRSVRKAVVMAVATLTGSVLPALPFIFGSSPASVLASVADHAPCRGGDRALPRLCGHLCDLASRLGAHGRPFDRRCMSGRERACRVPHFLPHPHDRVRQARLRLYRRIARRGGRFEHQKRQECACLVGFDDERVRLEVVSAGRSHERGGRPELPRRRERD